MGNYKLDLALLVYVETCICDTPLCNQGESLLDFHCLSGDFDIAILSEDHSVLNNTMSCYNNKQKQCYIMKYEGNLTKKCLIVTGMLCAYMHLDLYTYSFLKVNIDIIDQYYMYCVL